MAFIIPGSYRKFINHPPSDGSRSCYPPEKDKLGKRTPEETAAVDVSFDDWYPYQKEVPTVTPIVLMKEAFHAGYLRGKDVGESEAVESARMGE